MKISTRPETHEIPKFKKLLHETLSSTKHPSSTIIYIWYQSTNSTLCDLEINIFFLEQVSSKTIKSTREACIHNCTNQVIFSLIVTMMGGI